MTDQEAYREVERRIAMGLREGALELNLGFFQLAKLPEELRQLPMLQYLNLSDNRLNGVCPRNRPAIVSEHS